MNGIRAVVNLSTLLVASVWLGSADLLAAPGTAADDAMAAEVPRVAERINILDERFEIEQIRVTGVVDRPQWDISNSEINQLADELLADITDRQEIAERGFSEEEIDQILAKMLEIRNRSDDTQLGRVRLMNSLIRELDEMERERGLSIEEIEGIAGQIQSQYRDRGFLFARVIVPAQEVTDGVLTLEVLEGELGEVSVASNDVHSEEVVIAALNDLRGKPINKRELDEALRLINDKDSLNAFGQFQPGEIGSTDLQVQVTDERAWSGQTSIDNTGSDATGRWRGGINLSKYDVTGHGDTLTLGFSQTKEVTLGSVSYTAPLPNPRTVLRVSADTNEFAVGVGQGIKLEAETQNYRLNLSHTFRRSQDFSFDVIGETWFKDSLLDVLVAGSRIDVVSTDQRIVGGTLATQLGGLWRIPNFNTVYDASLGGSVGHFTFGEVPPNQDGFSGQDSTYFMGTFAFQSFSIYSLPLFGERALRQGLMLRLQGQYSEQFLPAVEQFGLGGAGKVRGYLADDLSVDNAVYAGLQLYTFVPEGMNKRIEWLDQTIGDLVKPFAFIDYSYGVRRASNTDTENVQDRWAEFVAAGLGFDYYLFRDQAGNFDLRGTFTAGFPIRSKFSDFALNAVDADKPRFYFTMIFDFDGDRMRRIGVPGFRCDGDDCNRQFRLFNRNSECVRRNGVIDCRGAFDGVDATPVGDGNPAASTTAVVGDKNDASEIAEVPELPEAPVDQEAPTIDTSVLEGLVDVAAPLSEVNEEPVDTPSPAAQTIQQPAAVQRASAEMVDVADSVAAVPAPADIPEPDYPVAPVVQREQPIVEQLPEVKQLEAVKPAWMAEKY